MFTEKWANRRPWRVWPSLESPRPGSNHLTERPEKARTGYFNCLRMKRSMVMCFCESWTIVPNNIVKRPP